MGIDGHPNRAFPDGDTALAVGHRGRYVSRYRVCRGVEPVNPMVLTTRHPETAEAYTKARARLPSTGKLPTSMFVAGSMRTTEARAWLEAHTAAVSMPSQSGLPGIESFTMIGSEETGS